MQSCNVPRHIKCIVLNYFISNVSVFVFVFARDSPSYLAPDALYRKRVYSLGNPEQTLHPTLEHKYVHGLDLPAIPFTSYLAPVMTFKIQLKLRDWQEKDVVQMSENIKTTTVTAAFDATQGAIGTFTSVCAMLYHHINKEDPHKSKATYAGYATFEGTITKDGKEMKGSVVMTDDGVYDGIPISTNKVISTHGDLKDIKTAKSYFEGKDHYVEFDM